MAKKKRDIKNWRDQTTRSRFMQYPQGESGPITRTFVDPESMKKPKKEPKCPNLRSTGDVS